MIPIYDLIENKKGELGVEYNFEQPNPKQLDFVFINLIFNERILKL